MGKLRELTAIDHAVRHAHMVRAKLQLTAALECMREAQGHVVKANKTQQAFKAKSLVHGVNSLLNDVQSSIRYHDRHCRSGERA